MLKGELSVIGRSNSFSQRLKSGASERFTNGTTRKMTSLGCRPIVLTQSVSTVRRNELPFEWSKHFVYTEDGTKCLGACALMALKYWGVEVSDEDCHRILSQLV